MTQSQDIFTALNQNFIKNHANEVVYQLETRSPKDVAFLITGINPVQGAAILGRMNPELAIPVVEYLDLEVLKKIFGVMYPLRMAPLLARVDERRRKELLQSLPLPLRNELKQIVSYPEDTAGRFMDPRPFICRPQDTVQNVFDRVRLTKDRRVLDVFVTGESGELIGKIPLQNVVTAEPNRTLKELIDAKPISVLAMAPRDNVAELMDRHRLVTLPVVDRDGLLVGVIRYDSLVDVVQEEAIEDLQIMVGAGSDEKALSPISYAVKKRLPWLSVNLLTTFIAASVVGLFESSIAKVTALAILMPVVAGQAGNTGAQALAVTMRGLSLKEFRIAEWWRVIRKEVSAGFANGLTIGALAGISIYFWSSNSGLAIVISLAMVTAMVAAAFAGTIIPILLTSLGQDPAQSSSIILTTVTDVTGLLSFLGLATLLMHLIL